MLAVAFDAFTNKAGLMKLALIGTALLITPSLGQTQPKEADGVTWPVVVINRSITKLDVAVWDDNSQHKQLIKQTMEGGQEITVNAVVKGGQRSLSWKVVALDDRGWKLKPGEKRPTRCGTGSSSDKKKKLEVSSQPNVDGRDC